MELQVISTHNNNKNNNTLLDTGLNLQEVKRQDEKKYQITPFILSNTKEVTYEHLKNDTIIPAFAKDNEKTIAHHEFIDITLESISEIFNNYHIDSPEIRASHIIKGRIPSAIHKSVKELLPTEKTIYYERMAFIVRIPEITETINGNEMALTIGGVRAYNTENLYSRKNFEKFKFFIGFQNMVCCNMTISTDGSKDDIRVTNIINLKKLIKEIITNYNIEKHIKSLSRLSEVYMTEKQFAQLIGKSKLYNYLPVNEKNKLPKLLLNDSQISTIAKEYYNDENFARNSNGNINLWNVYNLFTGANKSSYIDKFVSRGINAYEFSLGILKALDGKDSSYHWFLG